MEYGQLIKTRYSVRQFSDQPVEDEKLATILEAGRLAPTAINLQPQRVLVIRGSNGMEKLAACSPYTFGAPMAIAVCANRDEAWVRGCDSYNSATIDAAIIGTQMMLAIHDLGLGTTWVGDFNPATFRQLFHLPENLEPVVLFPLGYPAQNAEPSSLHPSRKSLAETVAYDSF